MADIVTAARVALTYVEGVTYEAFIDDSMRQDAVVRQLLVVGEAAKRVSDEFKATHPDVPWRLDVVPTDVV